MVDGVTVDPVLPVVSLQTDTLSCKYNVHVYMCTPCNVTLSDLYSSVMCTCTCTCKLKSCKECVHVHVIMLSVLVLVDNGDILAIVDINKGHTISISALTTHSHIH